MEIQAIKRAPSVLPKSLASLSEATSVAYLDSVLSAFMAISTRPQAELEKTYNAAADHYDHPAVSFWERYGRRTVDRLPLFPAWSFSMFVAAWVRPPFQPPNVSVQLGTLWLSISLKSC
ncbi:MAG: hypothetical protein WB586_09325 [Chthoniobacterales bacterium]